MYKCDHEFTINQRLQDAISVLIRFNGIIVVFKCVNKFMDFYICGIVTFVVIFFYIRM